MQPLFFFVIAVVGILGLASLSLLLMWKQIQIQNSQIQTLTNLATSKNLETFQNLQVMTNQQSFVPSEHEPANPLNDEAIAIQLAKQYENAGMDPNMAFAQSDDFFAEAGGIDNLRTF